MSPPTLYCIPKKWGGGNGEGFSDVLLAIHCSETFSCARRSNSPVWQTSFPSLIPSVTEVLSSCFLRSEGFRDPDLRDDSACRCVDMHYKSQSKSPAMVSYSCSSSGLCCIVVYCSCSKLSCVLLFPWLSQTGEIRLQPGYSPLWILSVGLLVFTHFKERCMSSTHLDWCGTKTLRTEDKSEGKGSKTSFLLGVWQFLCVRDLSSLKPNMKK